jgi:hypothetical protein
MGEPVNTPTESQGGGRPVSGRRVMRTGVGITLIAVGAILRFALPPGSPHGLNVHVVGVVLILVGVLGLLLSLLLGAGMMQPRRLTLWNTSGGDGESAGHSRIVETQQAAAEDVAAVQEDDRFFTPDTARSQEDGI